MWLVLWWIGFTCAAVWLQTLLPGVDFLAAGFILSLQEERPTVSVWLAMAWLFIQEGSGSLAFGTGILWYGFLAAVFYFGHWFFEAKNFVFMIILGVCLGCMHFVLTHTMAILQDWYIVSDRIVVESLLQATLFPMEWGLVYIMYHHVPRHEYQV